MCLYPVYVKGNWCACGHCLECLMARSNEWSFRIMNEASLYMRNVFVTLTYNEDNLPQGGVLVKRDLQLFVKRLRKKLYPQKVRYFACGEYGSKGKFHRPHYHIIVFGWRPDDMYYFGKDNKGNAIYRSEELEKLWQKGYSSIGELTKDSAKYCAKYLQKLNDLPEGRPKPFTLMSRKPAIGTEAINESMLRTDRVYANGKYTRVPRAYLEYVKEDFPQLYENIKLRRMQSMKKFCGHPTDNNALTFINGKPVEYRQKYSLDEFAYQKSVEKRRKKFFSIFNKIFKKKS